MQKQLQMNFKNSVLIIIFLFALQVNAQCINVTGAYGTTGVDATNLNGPLDNIYMTLPTNQGLVSDISIYPANTPIHIRVRLKNSLGTNEHIQINVNNEIGFFVYPPVTGSVLDYTFTKTVDVTRIGISALNADYEIDGISTCAYAPCTTPNCGTATIQKN